MSQGDVRASAHEQPVSLVGAILEGYACRGVFAGFRQVKRQAQKVEFAVQWHFRQILSIRLDAAKSTLTLLNLIPQASAAPNVRAELGTFLRHCASSARPVHRRIDPEKLHVACYLRNDSLSLCVTVLDGDYEYATRRLVHLVNEIFLDFLRDAQYVEYMVAHMDMNPETGGSL
ncbi:MAG TPA: hypothetical protein VNR18_12030 [Hyphomicrobiales bacterium]|nr:hypothetical protein [Hyphomicrobiales bacterium]